MDTVTFRCPATPGFGEVEGVLRLSAAALHLQFHLYDAVLGVRRPEVHQVDLRWDGIASAAYQQGWFGRGARIDLVLNDIQPLAQFPRSEAGFSLRLPWAQRRAGRKLVDELQHYLRDQRYARLQRDIDYLSKKAD
ncbi:hypothetical protein [Pseudomarimonas arenosa]|uniref:Uncharacterized protein n=1 Tax=Pseudomarimonas arenosa TaxID=2774145 RepID=A0AAW3ZK41_9GAMM|nr:hypothetical protein [Pseudomarimonas arenosa]MBD8526333.1 hypothetical protein [Pseudomarimonas arenosa]